MQRAVIRNLRKVSSLLGVTTLLAGCSGIGLLNGITPSSTYVSHTDVAFGTHGLTLDVYEPKGASGRAPVVVFFYGGSWQQNTTYPKQDYRFVGEALAAKGFVVVIPDYRLYPVVRYPAFLEDCAQALVWAHESASRFGGDADKLLVMGHSAGAYNAAMVTLDPHYLREAGGDAKWIKALIGLAGPYDFLPLDDDTLDAIFAPAKPLEESQPIDHVHAGLPPMLLLAGENDSVVYAKNTRNLATSARAQGDEVDEHIYDSMSHTWIVATLATRLQGRSDVMQRIVDFTAARGLSPPQH